MQLGWSGWCAVHVRRSGWAEAMEVSPRGRRVAVAPRIRGDVVPSVGMRLVPSATNHPGSRVNAASVVDADGSFWLLGGQRSDGYTGELWRINTTSWQWTWMAGPQ